MTSAAHGNWYRDRRWFKRRRFQLNKQPLCEMCLQVGNVTMATTADHIEPHRGDSYLFWFGQLQSLCQTCHSRHKTWLEAKGFTNRVDLQGYPVDANHPFNK